MYSPDELRELIPLYLNGRLSERERQEFEQTLEKYPELKRELREFSEIKEAYKKVEHEIPLPSPNLYQRIWRNIQSEAKVSTAYVGKRYIEKLQEFLKGLFLSPRLSWGVAVAQFVVILFLVVTLLGRDSFRTLTSPDTLHGEGIRINVIFNKESKEREIREVLNNVGATIIKGPSPEGLYTILVKEDQHIERVLKALRKTEIVRFAERAY